MSTISTDSFLARVAAARELIASLEKTSDIAILESALKPRFPGNPLPGSGPSPISSLAKKTGNEQLIRLLALNDGGTNFEYVFSN